jgi:4-aminobutyrate aminotransferase-like enzyme
VFDKSGNCWIDFTSTIFVANVGHSNPEVCQAIKKTVDSQLLNSYYYPTKIRQEFVRELLKQCSPNLNKAFLLTTGSESTEAAIKISKKYGRKKGKKYIISYNQSFHGKTMGAQMLGGKPLSKEWIDFQHPHIINVKFPYPWEKITFEDTLEELRELNIPLEEICAFITESYLGWCSCLLPKKVCSGYASMV